MSFTLTFGQEGNCATAQVVWSVDGKTYDFRSDNNFVAWISTIFTVADVVADESINTNGYVAVNAVASTDLNLLGPVGTKVDLFTVPAGYRFFAREFSMLITNVVQSGVMSGVTQPKIRAVKNNSATTTNLISNDIELNNAGQTVQIVGNFWQTSGARGGASVPAGSPTATAGEIISAYITTAIVPGVNTYTVFSGRCVLQGWMIPL